MAFQRKDRIGEQFGRLLVFERLAYRHWICICTCGEVVIRNVQAMGSKKVSSCGCYVAEFAANNWRKQAVKNRKVFGYAASRKTYNTKKREAKRKGIVFNITFEQFLELSSQNCYYCDGAPKNCSKFEKTFGHYKYNGMDKVNRFEGYTLSNVVPCCWSCNKAKSTLSQQEFLNLISNIYHNRIKNAK